MKTSLFPLALSSVLSTALAPLCGGLALQFWLSYGESIALVPQAVALTLLNLLAARAWLSYATERQRQADSSGHPLEQP